MTRVITESPALLARERQVFDRYARALAALHRRGDRRGRRATSSRRSPPPRSSALHRALIDHVRRRALAGATVPQIRRSVRAQARRGVALLERGLADYAPRG